MFILGLYVTPDTPPFERSRQKGLFRAATASLLGDRAKSTVTAQSCKEGKDKLNVCKL